MANGSSKELIEQNKALVKSIGSVVNTLDGIISENFTSSTSVVPVVGLNENGSLGLFEGGEPIALKTLTQGTTQETVIVKREIIVSSDKKDKQTVEEIDFDGDDFVASREGNAIQVSLKDRTKFIVYIKDEDPILTEDVVNGDFWFYNVLGKMYVRYKDVWVQPHPQ